MIWENVVHELKSRQMPPEDEPDLSRPTEKQYNEMVAWINDRLTTVKKDEPLMEPALAVLDNHCTSCHSETDAQSGLDIAMLIKNPLHQHSDAWEGIIRKMNARQMPPADKRWPDDDTYKSVIHLLPRDEVSHGFDNITVTGLSPTLMNSYISAAEKISRLAVGTSLPSPKIDVIRVKPDLTQSKRLEVIPHHFPRSGTYRVEVKLARDRNEFVEGLNGKYSVLLMLNKEVLKTFIIERPKGKLPHDKGIRN